MQTLSSSITGLHDEFGGLKEISEIQSRYDVYVMFILHWWHIWLVSKNPCLYLQSSYLSAASLAEEEIIGLLVVQYEMFWDVNFED